LCHRSRFSKCALCPPSIAFFAVSSPCCLSIYDLHANNSLFSPNLPPPSFDFRSTKEKFVWVPPFFPPRSKKCRFQTGKTSSFRSPNSPPLTAEVFKTHGFDFLPLVSVSGRFLNPRPFVPQVGRPHTFFPLLFTTFSVFCFPLWVLLFLFSFFFFPKNALTERFPQSFFPVSDLPLFLSLFCFCCVLGDLRAIRLL